jgi:hypothetical protein
LFENAPHFFSERETFLTSLHFFLFVFCDQDCTATAADATADEVHDKKSFGPVFGATQQVVQVALSTAAAVVVL